MGYNFDIYNRINIIYSIVKWVYLKYLDHISQVRHYLLFKNKGTRPWGTTVCKIHFTCRGKGPLITFNFKLGHQRILNHVFIIKDHIFTVRRLLKLIQPTVQALVVIHRIGICASLFLSSLFSYNWVVVYSLVLLPLCCSWLQKYLIWTTFCPLNVIYSY